MPYTPNAGSALAQAANGLSDYQYMTDVANRSQVILSQSPWIAQDPSALKELATSNVSTYDLSRQSGALYATQYADKLMGILQNQTPDNQSLVWNTLTEDQQATLAGMGYKAPTHGHGGGIHLPGPVGKIVGGGLHVVSKALQAPGIKQGLDALTWMGDQPAHVYRTIRMLPENTHGLGYLGAILGGAAAIALAPETGGLSLGFLAGTGGLLGASAATAAIAGPSDWIRTFRNTWDGERVWLPSAQRKARDLLGSDRLAGLASDLADHGDLTGFAESLAGQRDATNPGVWQRALGKYADEIVHPGDPAHDKIVAALQDISRVPEFMQAVRALQDGKISFGRDVARGLGLHPGQGAYNLVSGGLDAAWIMTLDPTLAAGEMLAWNKARKAGFTIMEGDNVVEALARRADEYAPFGRAADEAARAVREKSADVIAQNVPAFKGMWDGLLQYAKDEGIKDFSRQDLFKYMGDSKGMEAFLSGAGTRINETKMLLPRFGYKIGPAVLKPTELKAWTKALINVGDDANSARALEGIGRQIRTRIGEAIGRDTVQVGDRAAGRIDVIRSKEGYANIPIPVLEAEHEVMTSVMDYATKVPGVKQASAFLGAITTQMPKGAIRLTGPGSFDDMTRFVEIGRTFGMDSVQRRYWRNMILNADGVAQRRDVARSFLDAALTTAGVRDTEKGKAFADEFIYHVQQAYGVGDTVEMAGGLLKRGRTELDQAVEIPMPNLEKIRSAVRKGTITQVVSDIAGLGPIDSMMNGIWKPAILLRIGFIPRNAGEEMVGWFARHGPSEYLAQFGSHSVSDGQLYDEYSTLTRAGKKSWADGTAPWTDEDIESLERMKYAAHVRPVERLLSHMKYTDPATNMLASYSKWLRGTLADGIAPNSWDIFQRTDNALESTIGQRISDPSLWFGKEKFRQALAGKPESFRRVILAGADPELVRHMNLFTTIHADSIMRNLSAETANLAGDYAKAGHDRIVAHAGDPQRTRQVEYGVQFGTYEPYGLGDTGEVKMRSFSVGRSLDSDVYGPAKVELYHRTRPGSLRTDNSDLIARTDKLFTDKPNDPAIALVGEVLGKGHAQWGPALDKIAQSDPELAVLLHAELPDLPTGEELTAWLRKRRRRLDLSTTEVREIGSILDRAKSLPDVESSWLSSRGRWLQGREGVKLPETGMAASFRANLNRANGDLYSFHGAIQDGVHPDAPYFTHPMIEQAENDLTGALSSDDTAIIRAARDALNETKAAAAPDLLRFRREWTDDQLDTLRSIARTASDDYATVSKAPELGELQKRIRSAEAEALSATTDTARTQAEWDKQRLEELMHRHYPETVDPKTIPRPAILPAELPADVSALYPLDDPNEWLDVGRHRQDDFLQRAHERAHNDPRNTQAIAGMEFNQTMSDTTRVVNPRTHGRNVTHVPVISTPAAEALVNDLATKGRRAVRDELRQVISDSLNGMNPEDAKRLNDLGNDVIDEFIDRLAVQGAEGWASIVGDLADGGSHGSLPLAVMGFNDAGTAKVLSRIIENHYVTGPSPLDAAIAVGELHGPRDLADLGAVTRDGWRRPIAVDNGDGFTWNLDPHLAAHRVEPAQGSLIKLPNGQTVMGASWDDAQREHAAFMVGDANSHLRAKDDTGVELLWNGLAGSMWDKADEMAGTTLKNAHGIRTGDASALRARLLDQRTERAFRGQWEDWAGSVPPGSVLGPKLTLEDRKGVWQRFVQFGFGRVIGPSIDAAIRTPMAMHAFAEAMKAGKGARLWMRHPETWAALEDHFAGVISAARLDTPTADLARDLRKVLPSVESPAIVAQYADDDAALVRHAADLLSDSTAVDAVRALPGADAARMAEFPWWSVALRGDEAAVAPGMVRFYRGDFAPGGRVAGSGSMPDWVRNSPEMMTRSSVQGRWVTEDRNLALRYPANRDPNEVAQLRYVDVPEATARKIRGLADQPEAVRRLSVARDSEAVLPAEYADQLRPLLPADVHGKLVALYGDTLKDSLGQGWPAVRRASKDMPQSLREALNPESAAILDKAFKNDQRIERELGDYASQRAIAHGYQFIDSHDIRSQYGQIAKSFTPFWYAEENFMKRWGRTLMLNPAAVREGQLLYSGLKSGGIIKTDAQGKDWFVYPGAGLFAEGLGKITPLGAVMNAGPIFAATPQSMLPGFDPSQTGVPNASPLLAIGMDAVTRMFPELRPAEESVLGKGSINDGALSRFVPPQLRGIWDTFTKDEDTSRKYASAMMTQLQIMYANDQVPQEGASDQEIDAFSRNLRNGTRTIFAAQRVMAFIVPGSPQLQFTGDPSTDLNSLTGVGVQRAPDLLRSEYIQLVQQLGVEVATQQWIKYHGEDSLQQIANPMAYTVGQSESPSGAPIPASTAAEQWAMQHPDLLDRYPSGAPWLLPNDPNVKTSFDQYTYTQQVIQGLRVQRKPDDFMRSMMFKEGGVEYFTAKDWYEAKRNRLEAAGNKQDAIHSLDTQWKMQSDAFKALHPVFASELQSGDGQQRRVAALKDLHEMLADPNYPMDEHAQNVKTLLDSYDFFRYEVQRRSLQRDARSVKATAAFKQRYAKSLNDWLGEHEDLQSMWLTLLRPDAQLT